MSFSRCSAGFLLAALAFRVFYIQELFFAFLLFAILFLLLLLLVAAVFSALYVYARGVAYLAARISAEGHRALPLFRVLVLWFAPIATKTGALKIREVATGALLIWTETFQKTLKSAMLIAP